MQTQDSRWLTFVIVVFTLSFPHLFFKETVGFPKMSAFLSYICRFHFLMVTNLHCQSYKRLKNFNNKCYLSLLK